MIDELNKISKLDIPQSLAELKNKERRFKDSISSTDMKEYVVKNLGLN